MTTPDRQIARLPRASILIAVLAALLAVAVASTLPAHLHTGSAAARCDLCFTAHNTVYESPAVQPLPLPEMQGLATLLLPFCGYEPLSRRSWRSRGPPARRALSLAS